MQLERLKKLHKKLSDMINQGVILTAGKGSRILPLSLEYPKPLLPVCNKPIMQYQIETMRDAGIKEIVVVIGYLGQKIRDYFGNGHKLGVKLSYVFDKKPHGIGSSLLEARNTVDSPFALFLGDIFMSKIKLNSCIKKLVQYQADGVVVAIEEESLEAVKKDFAIVTSRDGKILKVVEKPTSPPNTLKGIGVYLFTPTIFQAISKTPASELRGEVELTDSIQTLINTGGRVFCDKQELWEINLSYPRDLLECNLRMLKEKKLNYLIGKGAKIGIQTQIVSSVIGERAVIKDFIIMNECLVFPDVNVKSQTSPAYHKIFTKDSVVST